ncbi:hypothetical protein ACOMHN_021826 [Nucella lapillus]
MNRVAIPAVTSLLLLLSTLSRAAPPDVSKASASDVSSDAGPYDDVSGESELAKRLSSFVRIGRPSSFVRIGRANHFVRIGRPGNFVRIGRGYEGNAEDDLGYNQQQDLQDYAPNKRTSSFVRIGKASSFVRIGKSGELMLPEDKRMSSFVRIGKGQPFSNVYSEDLTKRVPSFVRIGRTPTFAFLRDDSGMAKA